MEILGLIGGLMFLVGWIWLIVIGFKQGGALWGILIFLFSWIAGIIFAILKKEGWMQIGIMILGVILMAFGGVLSFNASFNAP